MFGNLLINHKRVFLLENGVYILILVDAEKLGLINKKIEKNIIVYNMEFFTIKNKDNF